MIDKVRLGIFDYVNIWPVYYRFLFEGQPPHFSLVGGPPCLLNRLLEEGGLDASCISSIRYPFMRRSVSLVPSLGLCTFGPVGSVCLISRFPLRDLDGKRIFVTDESSTSVVLLQILFQRLGVQGVFIPSGNPVEAFQGGGDGCLLIGDRALVYGLGETHGYHYDLGEWWTRETGKPFVWALWGIRNETHEPEGIAKALLDSRDRGLACLGAIAKRAAAKTGVGVSHMRGYYENFRYDLGREEIEGLLLFYRMASALGLSPEGSRLNFCMSEVPACR